MHQAAIGIIPSIIDDESKISTNLKLFNLAKNYCVLTIHFKKIAESVSLSHY